MIENEENLKIVEKLVDVINESGDVIVTHYVEWFIFSSAIWTIIGIGLVVFAKMWKAPDDIEIHPWAVRIPLLIIGILLIGVNLPDLLAPNGIAIHQLLNDLH